MKDPYHKLARYYDRFTEPLNRRLRQIALKMFPPQPGLQVLEVGCGTATNLLFYQQAGCRVSGIDLSPAMTGQARAKLGPQADLRLADASAMPFENGHFDRVLAMLTLHEMPGDIRLPVMKEMLRVLKPNGRLLIVDFHPGPLQVPKGWFYKLLILFFEKMAGREHFRNYRHFIRHKGLKPLLQTITAQIEKEKILAGGNIALLIIKKAI